MARGRLSAICDAPSRRSTNESGPDELSATIIGYCPGPCFFPCFIGSGPCGSKPIFDFRQLPTFLAWECGRFSLTLALEGKQRACARMWNSSKSGFRCWSTYSGATGPVAASAPGEEFVGLCPLHPDTQPSFYVNARKNLFYCHGCHRGGDLIRFVELSQHRSFRESLDCLQQELALATEAELL